MTERLEGSRETQRCPTCGSFFPEKRGILEHERTGGPGRVNLERWRELCPDPWHGAPAAPETPPERSEDFWINACLHILYCQKEWSKKCPVCHRIAEIVTAEKEAVVTGEFLETGTPRKEEA